VSRLGQPMQSLKLTGTVRMGLRPSLAARPGHWQGTGQGTGSTVLRILHTNYSTHTEPIFQVGSSHYRNGCRKLEAVCLLHPGRPRGLTSGLCGIPKGHHQSIEEKTAQLEHRHHTGSAGSCAAASTTVVVVHTHTHAHAHTHCHCQWQWREA
jgi:hypothetical protein